MSLLSDVCVRAESYLQMLVAQLKVVKAQILENDRKIMAETDA